MIELKNVSLQYENGTTALYDINLDVRTARWLILLGPPVQEKAPF